MKIKIGMFSCALGLAGALCAADYVWLAQPGSNAWLDAPNWNLGVWTADAANTATIGTTSEPEIDVNGAVALKQLTVNADASLANGTLALNGPFTVGAGATATVASSISQTDAGTAGTRFAKEGAGTLVLTGANRFHRLRAGDGLLHFKGGVHDIVGTSTAPNETSVILSLARGDVLIDDGAVVTATNRNNAYFANSGARVVVSNGTFKVSTSSEFLNGFSDNNVLAQPVSSITVETNGVFEAGKFRLGKGGLSQPDDYGLLQVNRGGKIRVREFSMDLSAQNYKGALVFDGGEWEVIDDGATAVPPRLGPSTAATTWPHVTVGLLEGGLRLKNRNLSWYYAPVSGVGGVHFTGGSVTYWWGQNLYTGGNHLEGGTTLAIGNDANFGAVPETPTDNIFFDKSAVLHFGSNTQVAPTRDVRIAADVVASVGTQNSNWSRFRGAFSCAGTTSVLRVAADWNGWTELAPANGRTNTFHKMQVYGQLRIGDGTTLVTQDCGAHIDSACPLYIEGKGGKFGTYGTLAVTGGVLRVTRSNYTIAKKYAQVVVSGGLLDTSAQNEYINGLSGVARTTVSGTGELRASSVRISQCPDVDPDTRLPLTEVNVRTGGVIRLKRFYIDENFTNPRGSLNLDGGTLVARENNDKFLGTSGNAKSWNWTNILARVCAGGAVFDSAGFNITVVNPLLSAAERDGGLTKKGAGTLTLSGANTYNGPTRLAGGRVVFSRAGGFPGGDLDFDGAALQAKDRTTPLVEMNALAFRDGCGVRVVNAGALDSRTFGKMKVVAKFTTPLAGVPDCVYQDAQGAAVPPGYWKFYISDDGKTLSFGADRGCKIIIR